jgi:2-oxoglutarate dehydrogenase E1 component
VTAYRSRGHLRADLDPLGMATKAEAPDLDLAFHGLDSDDLGTEFSTQTFFGPDRMQLKDLLGRLRATYCGHDWCRIHAYRRRRPAALAV